MLDIQNNKRQGSSGGLSSRPSQISLIRRNEGINHNELKRSSSPTSNLRGMSADAAERWSNKPKPASNLRGMSADAAERWSNKPKPASNLRGMSADAAERWSNSANSRGTYNIRSGDTLSAIAKRELGSSSRWREIKKPDGSSFSTSEAGRLRVGQQISLPGTSSSTNNRSGGQTSNNLRGMSADAADAWSGVTRTRSTQSRASSNTWNNALSRTVQGTAVGAFVASRNSGSFRTYSNFDTSAASRNSVGSRASSNFSIGRMTERAWNEHLDSRPDVIQNIRQTTWKDPRTGRSLRFPSAASRRPDNFLMLNNGRGGTALEIKGTPSAAESPLARRQLERDRSAIRQGARLGNKKIGFYEVRNIEIKTGLPVLGAGGNTALPGEIQKHVMIKPQSINAPHTRVPQLARAVGESRAASVALRGVSRVAAPVAVGLDAWRLKDAYQQDGFGQEFRKEAGRVAGGWGGAAAGAAGGAAIGSVVPVVGTAAGAIVGGVIGGVAGSEFGDDIEQGAEKAGKAIADGAKNAWSTLNPFD